MKRILIPLLLSLLAVPAYAQTWDRVNGSMQVKSGPTAPLVIIDQTQAGQKILSLRSAGVEKCSVNTSGNLVCSGTFTLTGQFLAGDGTAPLPAYSFTSEPNLGLYRASTGVIAVGNNNITGGIPYALAPTQMRFGQAVSLGWSSADSALTAADTVLSRGAADRLDLATGDSFEVIAGGLGVGAIETTSGRIRATAGYSIATLAASGTAPTLPVACSVPTITWSNGTAAFQIDVGTTCAGISTLAVTMPATTNAWVCVAFNTTTSATGEVEMTASTTTSATFTNYTRTTGVALAWVDGADIRIGCWGG